jgi:two-component system NtrC family sensor kinase
MGTTSTTGSIREFFDDLECGVILLDTKLAPIWSNRYYEQHIARHLQMCDQNCFTGMNPGDLRCQDCLPPQVLRTGRTLETLRNLRDEHGAELRYRVVLTAFGDEDGVAVFILPLEADEHAPGSAWRERFLLSAIRNSNDAIFALDRQNTVRFWNRGAEQLFGWTIAETVGRGLTHLFVEDEPGTVGLFAPEDARQEIASQEIRMHTRARGTVWVDVSRTPLLDGSDRPNGYSFVVRDITERRAAMEKMAFTERMSAVGNMAAALAHEIGTPLGVISSSTEYLMLDLPEGDERREDLSMILSETERIGGLVKNLLEFSRPEAPVFEPLDLTTVVDRVERLARHSARNQSTELVVDSNGPAMVEGDANQLEQVLLNLTINAMQALGSGGAVRVALESTDGDVILTVEDDGPGIAPEAAEGIFHPFFTTKPNGTGLGLAVAKRIVEDHGGSLSTLEREVGAAFQVRLPILKTEA